MTQISILGCGWLGLPLAKSLLKKGFSVKGSTTSNDKLSMLKNSGINPFLIALSENKIEGEVTNFLDNSNILIIDVPPKLRGSNKDPSTVLRKSFVSKIENLIPFIEKSSAEKVLFISSTSVYGDSSSLDCAREDSLGVTEETIPNPETESGKQLLEAEQLLQSNPNFKTIVLRFGGLIGEDRHPVRFLSGKTNLENPDAPINLIHQEDCIGIIMEILQQNCWNETFNAVAPFHPSRKAYYTQKAIEMELALPQFSTKNTSFGKTISSAKIEKVLNYSFLKPKL